MSKNPTFGSVAAILSAMLYTGLESDTTLDDLAEDD